MTIDVIGLAVVQNHAKPTATGRMPHARDQFWYCRQEMRITLLEQLYFLVFRSDRLGRRRSETPSDIEEFSLMLSVDGSIRSYLEQNCD